jgi:hypothetical protein
MSIVIDGRTLVPVRAMVENADGDPVTNTTAIDIPIQQLLGAVAASGVGIPVAAATTAVVGGVKKTPAIADLAGGADLPTTVTKINAILAALRTAGLITV